MSNEFLSDSRSFAYNFVISISRSLVVSVLISSLLVFLISFFFVVQFSFYAELYCLLIKVQSKCSR